LFQEHNEINSINLIALSG